MERKLSINIKLIKTIISEYSSKILEILKIFLARTTKLFKKWNKIREIPLKFRKNFKLT